MMIVCKGSLFNLLLIFEHMHLVCLFVNDQNNVGHNKMIDVEMNYMYNGWAREELNLVGKGNEF